MFERSERTTQLLNQTGLQVQKVTKHRDGDRTVTYVLEATDSNGNVLTGIGTATRRPSEKFKKSIGHEVADAYAIQDLAAQVNPNLLSKKALKRVLKARENRIVEETMRVAAKSL
jgi:hypothetical protein